MNLRPDRVLIQGITEPLGSYYAVRMKAYGTNVVGGVSPGQGGQLLDGIPIFDLVEQALPVVGRVDTTIIFVQPYWAIDAALEAIAAGIRQIILVTAGIPPLDMVCLLRKAEDTGTVILGPSSSGIIVPEKILLGIQESEFYTPGVVGLISRSGTLTYEVAWELTQAGLGESICVSLGRDAIVGSGFPQWLKALDEDESTKAIVLVGQAGGGREEATAEYIAAAIDKPVVAYFAGSHAPLDRRMGDANNIISYHMSMPIPESGTAQRQITAFKQAKIPVAKRPSQIPELVKKALKK
ncbi:MAG: CoA-binding protein [Aphanothece sp. CMT-3BRIN-NPC111]|nr:CoA-binding protein [Aphanothece sp. CMT-3BRIN-NPC111]